MGPEAVSTDSRNYEHRMTAVERGNILASEEKGGGHSLEVRQKGYLKIKGDNVGTQWEGGLLTSEKFQVRRLKTFSYEDRVSDLHTWLAHRIVMILSLS